MDCIRTVTNGSSFKIKGNSRLCANLLPLDPFLSSTLNTLGKMESFYMKHLSKSRLF